MSSNTPNHVDLKNLWLAFKKQESFVLTLVGNFPRNFKYNIGNRLLDHCLDLVEGLSMLIDDYNEATVSQVKHHYRCFMHLIMLCQENHLISVKALAQLVLNHKEIKETFIGKSLPSELMQGLDLL